MRPLSVKVLSVFATFGVALAVSAQAASPVTLDIHVDQIKAHSSPLLYGLMTEEINHSYDGGLYGDLIRNAAAHPTDSWGAPVPDWLPVERGDSQASLASDKTTGPSAALPFSLKLTISRASTTAPAGIANAGYWGIPLRPATRYSGSFYAKAGQESGTIHIALVNNNTGVEAAHADIPALSGEWKQYRFTLNSTVEQRSSLHRHPPRNLLVQPRHDLPAHLSRPPERLSH